ncbi:unnamed protein product, partial [Effrenium voratum]
TMAKKVKPKKRSSAEVAKVDKIVKKVAPEKHDNMSDEKFHALNKTLARRGLQQFQSRAAFDNFRKKTRERQRQAKPPLFSMETARKMSGKRHHNEVLASLVALYIVARALQGKSSESLLSLKLHGFASGSLTVSQLKRFLDFRTPKVQLATTVEQSRAAAFLQ